MPRPLPKLVTLYLRNIAIGFALAGFFVAMLLWKDVAGLWSLASSTQGGWIAIAMLLLFNGLVFSGVQFAIAIMMMAENDTGSGHKQRTRKQRVPAPVQVTAHKP